MDCKKALLENDNDVEKAIDWLREKGIAKVAKKSSRIAAEGKTNVLASGMMLLFLKSTLKLTLLLIPIHLLI